MSNIYKFTVGIALLAVAFLGFCILSGYHGLWLLATVFLMPVLWMLWIACVGFDKSGKIWMLILLWLLIDIAVLGALTLVDANMSKGRGTGGMDYMFVIAFSPIILPAMLISALSSVAGDGFIAVTQGLIHLLFPNGLAGILSDWFATSIICAISSCLIVSPFYWWKAARSHGVRFPGNFFRDQRRR